MSSGLKTGLAIALLLAAVFVVTVISQLTPTSQSKTDPGTGPDGDPNAAMPVLAVTVSEYHYDPNAEPLYWYNRQFNGFFEVGSGGSNAERRNWVRYVFRNVRPNVAHLSPLNPSCPVCTSAQAATMTNAVVQEFAVEAALSNFAGIGGIPNPLAAIAWARQEAKLEWFTFDFAQPKRMYPVPAASNPQAPTWVFLDLDFHPTAEAPPMTKYGNFEVYNDKNEKVLYLKLSATFAAREAFEIWPKAITVGEMPEGIEPRSYEVVAFSMTRTADKWTAPDVAVNGNDPTVSVSPPIAMSNAECEQTAARLSNEFKGAVNVLSGYRYTVTVRRQVDGQTPKVEEFEKEIHFARPGLTTKTWRLPLKGQVTGAITVDGAAKIELGTYESAQPFRKEFRLVSEKTGLDIELVPGECKPEFVKFALGPPEVAFGRKTWKLTATIAEQTGRKPSWDGTVVVRTKGADPQTFVFKMTGYGR